MEIKNLKTFQVVAEKLNITLAAKELKYTQPTVTLQIQALEQQLNHKLFTRVGKETFLTSAGKKLKKHADQLLAHLEEIEKEMRELHGPSGNLTIAASEYYCSRQLSAVLTTYIQMYPNMRINLLPLNSKHAIESVRNNIADLAIVAGEEMGNDVKQTVLGEEKILLTASAKISKDKTIEELFTKYPFISYDEDCSISNLIKKYFKGCNLKPHSTIICGGSDETIKNIILNDTGYAILSENIIKKELMNGQIKILDEVEGPVTTSAVHLKIRSDEPNIQTFLELLKNAWHVVSE